MVRKDAWRLDRHEGFAKRLASLVCDDHGATAVEYSLIAVFVAAIIVAVVTVLGAKVSIDFTSVIGKF